MKKLLSFLAVVALLLGLATVAGAGSSTDPATFDTSVFVPAPYEDGCEGVECWEPIGLGIYHFWKDGIDCYHWLNKFETIPAVTEENGGCFTFANLAPATVVFWDGVPNLPKDMFKVWEGTTKDVYIPDSVTEIAEDAFVMNSTITLHFTANNAVALAYAEARGMNYEIVPEPDPDASQPDVSDPDVSDPDTSEPPTYQGRFDTSVFEVPADLYDFDRDYDECYLGVECYDPIGFGIYHYVKGGIDYYQWLDKMEKIPAATEENGSICSSTTIVFWNGVPNLSKNLFKWAEGTTKDVYIPDSVTEIDEDAFVMNSTITLHFTKNNKTALAYVQNRGMAFEVMDGERVLGDVNFDESTDMKDVLALRKSIAHLSAAYEIYSLDINGDNESNMKDVLALRKQIANAAA